MSASFEYPSDEQLTAFLDGELPLEEMEKISALAETGREVSGRLEALAVAVLPLKPAFAMMLEAAPEDRLKEALAGALASHGAIVVPERRAYPDANPGRRAFVGSMAAAAAALAVGVGIGRFIRGETDQEREGWHMAVARYMSLYTRETISNQLPDVSAQQAQIALLNQRMGLAFTLAKLSLGGRSFRRALLLAYEGAPLAQINYQDAEGSPLALCILKKEGDGQPPEARRLLGLNAVVWGQRTYQALLIGKMPPDQLAGLADEARRHLNT